MIAVRFIRSAAEILHSFVIFRHYYLKTEARKLIVISVLFNLKLEAYFSVRGNSDIDVYKRQLVDWRYVVMWIIGGILIFLAIKKDMEPTLLLPLGFGTILVNIPFSGAIGTEGPLTTLLNAGIANELFPLILFIGIGAMIDFTPLLANPKLMLFGAAAQFGIFFTFCLASIFFDIKDAASILSLIHI